MNFIF